MGSPLQNAIMRKIPMPRIPQNVNKDGCSTHLLRSGLGSLAAATRPESKFVAFGCWFIEKPKKRCLTRIFCKFSLNIAIWCSKIA